MGVGREGKPMFVMWIALLEKAKQFKYTVW